MYLPSGASEEDLAEIKAQIAAIAKRQADDTKARKWALVIGGIGALFAAVRLGIVAFPVLQKRRRQ